MAKFFLLYFVKVQFSSMTDWGMFQSEPLCPEDKVPENQNASCPMNESFIFGYIILFNWDEEIQKPFRIFSRKTFSTDEIRDRCYTKHLTEEFRVRKIKPLKALCGQKLSIFAKVEHCK